MEHCGFFPLLTPLGQIRCQRFTWIPQSLTLQLPITHRLKAPWCSESFCSHLVPSMKLSSRLTMNSLSTALHMCLHSRSPGGGRQEEDTWLTTKKGEEVKRIWQKKHPSFTWTREMVLWLQSTDRAMNAPFTKKPPFLSHSLPLAKPTAEVQV